MTLQHSSVKNSHVKIQDKKQQATLYLQALICQYELQKQVAPMISNTQCFHNWKKNWRGVCKLKKTICMHIHLWQKKGSHFLIEFDSIVESWPLRTHSKQSNPHIVLWVPTLNLSFHSFNWHSQWHSRNGDGIHWKAKALKRICLSIFIH
jgi:hypothetical protein